MIGLIAGHFMFFSYIFFSCFSYRQAIVCFFIFSLDIVFWVYCYYAYECELDVLPLERAVERDDEVSQEGRPTLGGEEKEIDEGNASESKYISPFLSTKDIVPEPQVADCRRWLRQEITTALSPEHGTATAAP